MKNKINFENILSVLLIIIFLSNILLNAILFICNKNTINLIIGIIFGICLLFYSTFLYISERSKVYFLVYDDFYIVNKINIIKKSKFLAKKKTYKYKKYNITSDFEEKYKFVEGKVKFSFKLIKVSDAKKVMIVSNKTFDKFFSLSYYEDSEEMKLHYLLNHDIAPFNNDAIVKNKEIIGIISEVNDKFTVSFYRYVLLIGVSSLKEIKKYDGSWEYDGSSMDSGIEYFNSYDEAKSYILK